MTQELLPSKSGMNKSLKITALAVSAAALLAIGAGGALFVHSHIASRWGDDATYAWLNKMNCQALANYNSENSLYQMGRLPDGSYIVEPGWTPGDLNLSRDYEAYALELMRDRNCGVMDTFSLGGEGQ